MKEKSALPMLSVLTSPALRIEIPFGQGSVLPMPAGGGNLAQQGDHPLDAGYCTLGYRIDVR